MALVHRHREAARFLLMHDMAGILRPFVEIIECCRPGMTLRMPACEIVAIRAVREVQRISVHEVRHSPFGRAPPGIERGASLHLADVVFPSGVPEGLQPAIVLEPKRSPPTPFSVAGHLRAFKILRRAGTPPALSFLLAHRLRRVLSGRLEGLSDLHLTDRELAASPVVYWANLSMQSVFHASERRARGLPTLAAHTILMSDSAQYHCGVFDGALTVGTGQGPAGVAYRTFAAVAPGMAKNRNGPILLALQPANDIMRSIG
ncbi:MAG: hypothetical protein HC869_12910, partial [Rhodospirillales bacterium]|nr:hypothetical protein [Rhodospirillales bacterium]